MTNNQTRLFEQKLIDAFDVLIPNFESNPLDAFANGNVAVCVIFPDGKITAKIWGENKIVGRNFFRNAWLKASQAWITEMPTGEYERRLFNDEFDEEKYGISKPDLIGWEGGQVFLLDEHTQIAVGFSGFRGFNDVLIAKQAFEMVYNELKEKKNF